MTFPETLKAFRDDCLVCVYDNDCRKFRQLRENWADRLEIAYERDKLELEKQAARDAAIFVQAGTEILSDADFKRVVARMFELNKKSEEK